MRRSFLPSLFLCLSTAWALSGCVEPSSPDPEQEVGRALDAAEISQKESELVVSSIVMLDPGAVSPNDAAKLAATRAEKVFSPASCVQAEAEGNTVTYLLDRCWGPFKSHTLTGSVMAVYSTTNDALHVYLHAEDLKVGKLITLDIDSEGTLSIDPSTDTRIFDVSTEGSGVGSRGNHIERKGKYTLTWTPSTRCVTFDGDFKTTTNARFAHTVVTGFSRCAGQCPQAPGEIFYETSENDYAVTISFDGTTEPSWTSSDGRKGKIDLFCGTSP